MIASLKSPHKISVPLEIIHQKCEYIDQLPDYEFENILEFMRRLPDKSDNLDSYYYNQLLIAIAEKLSSLSDKIGINVQIDILTAFSKKISLSDPKQYNAVLDNIDETISIEDQIKISEAFTARGINNFNFFRDVSEKLLKNPDKFMGQAGYMAYALAQLKFNDQKWAIDLVSEFSKEIKKHNYSFGNTASYVKWIWGLINFSMPKDMIDENVSQCNKLGKRVQMSLISSNLANYFDQNPEETSLNFDYSLQEIDLSTRIGVFPKKIANILKNEKIVTNHLVSNIWTPCYLPSKNTVIWPLTPEVLLYDKVGYRGTFDMHIRMLKNHAKVLFIDNYIWMTQSQGNIET